MEATVRKPRKRNASEPTASDPMEVAPVIAAQVVASKPPKSKASDSVGKIVFVTPADLEKQPVKPKKASKEKKQIPATEPEKAPLDSVDDSKVPGKNKQEAKVLSEARQKTESQVVAQDRSSTVAATPMPKDTATQPKRPRQEIATPIAKLFTATPEEPKVIPQKKQTQASWDKWVKQTVIAVSPDVWNIHASELSHSVQPLTDLKRIPRQILLDTPTLDYLFRCPDRLSHGARMMLNEEDVQCLVSMETFREWSDKMRAGQYIIEKLNSFFDKILDRFDLKSIAMDTEAYQKYASLQSPSHIDIEWERKPDDLVSTRLDAEARPTRILAAQALVLGIPIVSPDLRFGAYKKEGLKMIW